MRNSQEEDNLAVKQGIKSQAEADPFIKFVLHPFDVNFTEKELDGRRSWRYCGILAIDW